MAQLGGICAMLVLALTPPTPLFIMGFSAILAGCLTFIFPETLGQKLPQTLEEALNIRKETTRDFAPVEKSI